MNLQEAYSILELPFGSSEAEVKKRYREFTKKYHPDVNKETEAEDKFKKINEAYSLINTPNNKNPRKFTYIDLQPIELHVEISFKESVLGCKKALKFTRKNKCPICDGQGERIIDNGCPKCKGKGKIVQQQGNFIISRTCDKCMGKSDTKICDQCEEGVVETETSITVNIPGGVKSGNVLRLGGMGNYVGLRFNQYSNPFFEDIERFTDAHVNITVQPYFDLKIMEENVVSELELSLLEAIQGTKKHVNTIIDLKEVAIPPLSKNKDEILLPNLGVNAKGSHKLVLKVNYPTDAEDLARLVEALKQR